MASQEGPGQAPKTYLLKYLGLFFLYWTPSYGLEYQEWVLIRTLDGTAIATNWALQNQPVDLKADLSKFFGEKLCYNGRLHSRNPAKAGPLEGVAEGAGNECENDGNKDLNRDLFHTELYACPEPEPAWRGTCGGGSDFYCKAWGCETIVLPGSWGPGRGPDPHITMLRNRSRTPSQQDPQCGQDACNPTVVTVINPSDPEWLEGRTWGLRLYMSGWDIGTMFTVRKLPTRRPLQRGKGNGLPSRPPRPSANPLPGPSETPTITPTNDE